MTRTDLSSTTSDTPASIDQERTWLEGIARQFEVAWQRGDRPALTDFLPAGKAFTELLEAVQPEEARSLKPVELKALLLELARIDLSHRLNAGEPARVETYMERFPELAADDELLLELIATEYQQRLKHEPGLPIEGFLARFPACRNELAMRLGNLTAPPEPDDGLPPGPGPWPTIKDYTILEIIKEGGQGVVYKARQERLNRIVAVKVIHRERWANTEWARKRFAQEARAAAQLMHSHIAIVHDFNQSDDVDYIVMEFVDGVNLQDLVAHNGPLSVDEACEYIRQAALGLQHAHERGLVHRDIMPGNLIVTLPSGGVSAGGRPLPFRGAIVKILDMGLARLSVQPGISEDDTPAPGHPMLEEPPGERTPPGSVMGTPDFIAPEQWEDARSTDIRADLYSLG
ncbi:MAG: serine/threonine-protein kinase, partial [Gemmataceae bacterium]